MSSLGMHIAPRTWTALFLCAAAVLCGCGQSFSNESPVRDAGVEDGASSGGNSSGGTGAGGSGGAAAGGVAPSGGSAGTGGAPTAGRPGSGGAGTGGIAAAGGRVGTGGAPSGGFAGCGPCPGYVCPQGAIRLQVSAQGGTGGGVLGSIVVQGSGLDMKCQRSGCTFICTSTESQLADGKYSLSVTAPGYRAQTVDVQVANPTNCGCCGCCPFSTTQNVVLVPDGTAISGCCSDLQTDPNNCGVCGKQCATDAWCAKGACTPSYSACVGPTDGFASCSAYCKSLGKVCAASCGPSGSESLHWWGQGSVKCGDNTYSSNGTCADPLSGFTGARCCCSGT